ncbi:MAG: hypothetical protein IKP71_03505, partial [Candidatus Riflebacteria bacterium]|nr:hypothetical protein [Candidatus Riflebacteria bacterium]
MKKIIILFTILSIIILTACGGGGGSDGVSTNNSGSNDLFKIISNISRNVSSDTATQVGALSSDGIQLDLAKGALNNNSNVTIRQYSNDAASARFSENFPSLASFTVVSSLYELTAKDNNSKTQTLLEVPSELSVALSEDLNTNKLYYAVIKQNGEWSLLPIETNSANNSSRFVYNTSKSIRIII